MKHEMLKIENLYASVEDKPILTGVNLRIPAGELHAIMGPNGSGKSTLANVLAGRDGYVVTAGTVELDGDDLLALEPEERAQRGVFLAMQYPVEIPGVSNLYFLRTALNAIRRQRGEPELDVFEFLERARERMQLVGLDEGFTERSVNAGFSGGEKKRNEIFQLAMLEPRLAILDETDSGLDIDALRQVAAGINALRNPNRSMLLITHYQRLLEYVRPDKVHVFARGAVVRSGNAKLAELLEAEGYAGLASRSVVPAEAQSP
jgi:Fe-S cluster assembly ATP-binding protein